MKLKTWLCTAKNKAAATIGTTTKHLGTLRHRRRKSTKLSTKVTATWAKLCAADFKRLLKKTLAWCTVVLKPRAKLSIKSKLGIICAFSIVLNAVVLLISAHSIKSLEQRMQSFYNIEYQNSMQQRMIREDIKDIERSILTAVYVSDSKATASEVDALVQKTLADMNFLKRQFSDQSLITALNAAMNDFVAQKMRIMSYIFAEQPEKIPAILQGDYADCIQNIYDVLDDVALSAQHSSEQALKQASQQRRLTNFALTATTLVLNLVLFGIIGLIYRSITKASQKIVAVTGYIQSGNLSQCNLTHSLGDELDQVICACLSMSDALGVVLCDLKALLERIASGDLTPQQLNEHYFIGEYHAILQATQAMQHYITESLCQIDAATLSVEDCVSQVSHGAQGLLVLAQKQESNITALSQRLSHILKSATHNADVIAAINNSTTAMGKIVAQTQQQMNAAVLEINSVTQQAINIQSIVQQIDEIAMQTNLLALNASIEAAHAGIYAKGFSVIAGEIKNLAQKASAAAKETEAYISSSIVSFNGCAKSINETARSLNQAANEAASVSQSVAQVSAALQDEQQQIVSINHETRQISQIVAQNARTAAQFKAAGEQGITQVVILKQQLARFEHASQALTDSSI